MIGKIIAHYKILEKLGEGGMGVVCRAEDTKLKRTVALKFLPPDLTRGAEAKERFVQEAQAASALEHNNICNIHEINEAEDGGMYIVMAYYAGETLKQKIAQGPLAAEEAIDIALQIAAGLAKAHGEGIVHRDIKPANIMCTDDGEVKILDFGLAKLAGQTKLTRVGTTLGTISYMSPEQTQGKEVDQRSDIWSLGVVLYEMLTGELPFKGDYEQAVVYSILNQAPDPVTSLVPGISPELGKVVEKMLCKDPAGRYQTSRELLADLQSFRQVTVSQSLPASRINGQKAPSNKKRMGLAALITVVVVAAAGYLGISKLINRGNPPSGEIPVPEESGGVENAAEQKELETSIVVLPFDDISPSGDNEYFSDGLTEEIIADLSGIHTLRVISRTSAMKLKNTDKDARTIGRELNVQYILEGSVRKAGDDLRITAQLIDAASDKHVWAEKYDGTLEDIFDLQESVSRSIVDNLRVKLSPEEQRTIAERPIDDAKAFEYYFKAKQEIRRGTEAGLQTALSYIKAGLDIVGDNPVLYEGMGMVYFAYINYGIDIADENFAKIEECAAKISEIEPESPRAHFLLGLLNSARGDVQPAVMHFKKVLAADPNRDDVLNTLVIEYANVGQIEAARSMIDRVEAIDPLSPLFYKVLVKIFIGEFESAVKTGRELYQKDPQDASGRIIYALSLLYVRSFDEAVRIFDEFAEDEPEHGWAQQALFMRNAIRGNKDEAAKILQDGMLETSKLDTHYSWFIATGYALLDEKDGAIEWMGRAIDNGFLNYPFINEYDPFLKKYHSDPRFQELLQRLKSEWENFEV
jgi:non-specific serine/threonine protein kinase